MAFKHKRVKNSEKLEKSNPIPAKKYFYGAIPPYTLLLCLRHIPNNSNIFKPSAEAKPENKLRQIFTDFRQIFDKFSSFLVFLVLASKSLIPTQTKSKGKLIQTVPERRAVTSRRQESDI